MSLIEKAENLNQKDPNIKANGIKPAASQSSGVPKSPRGMKSKGVQTAVPQPKVLDPSGKSALPTMSSIHGHEVPHEALNSAHKTAQIGERRTWGGHEYVKTADGWDYVPKGPGNASTDLGVKAAGGGVKIPNVANVLGKKLEMPKVQNAKDIGGVGEKVKAAGEKEQGQPEAAGTEDVFEMGSIDVIDKVVKGAVAATTESISKLANKIKGMRSTGELNTKVNPYGQKKLDMYSTIIGDVLLSPESVKLIKSRERLLSKIDELSDEEIESVRLESEQFYADIMDYKNFADYINSDIEVLNEGTPEPIETNTGTVEKFNITDGEYKERVKKADEAFVMVGTATIIDKVATNEEGKKIQDKLDEFGKNLDVVEVESSTSFNTYTLAFREGEVVAKQGPRILKQVLNRIYGPGEHAYLDKFIDIIRDGKEVKYFFKPDAQERLTDAILSISKNSKATEEQKNNAILKLNILKGAFKGEGPRKIVEYKRPRISELQGMLSDFELATGKQGLNFIEGSREGKGVLKVVVPKEKSESIPFGSIIEKLDNLKLDVTRKEGESTTDFKERQKYKLKVPLGEGTDGSVSAIDLTNGGMLVAGTTGMGKSTYIASVITSMTRDASPNDLQITLVDPKKSEFTRFANLPHLSDGKILTTPEEAISKIKKLVKLSDDRRLEFTRVGVTNIEDYNKYIDMENMSGKNLTRMSRQVLVVDEFADLVRDYPNEFREGGNILRLASDSNAGIGCILGTQRPSQDVITGTLKSKFTHRVAFNTQSKINSQIALGEIGSENLPQGVGLYIEGAGKNKTLFKSPFLSDSEVRNYVAGTQGLPVSKPITTGAMGKEKAINNSMALNYKKEQEGKGINPAKEAEVKTLVSQIVDTRMKENLKQQAMVKPEIQELRNLMATFSPTYIFSVEDAKQFRQKEEQEKEIISRLNALGNPKQAAKMWNSIYPYSEFKKTAEDFMPKGNAVKAPVPEPKKPVAMVGKKKETPKILKKDIDKESKKINNPKIEGPVKMTKVPEVTPQQLKKLPKSTLKEISESKGEGNKNYKFNMKDTGVPTLTRVLTNPEYMRDEKGMNGKVVEMSPDEYISEAVKGFWNNMSDKAKAEYGNSFEKYKDVETGRRASNKENIKRLEDVFTGGKEMHMPYLEYQKEGKFSGQEGLHRAIAAKNLGIDKMPVLKVNAPSESNKPKGGTTIGKKMVTPAQSEISKHEQQLIGEAKKYKTEKDFVDEMNRGGYGTKSIGQLKQIIDKNSKGNLDFNNISKKLLEGGEQYYETTIDPKNLNIEDKDVVTNEVSKFKGEKSNAPIVVGKDGNVIDGRHRAVQAMKNGEKIKAYVPISEAFKKATNKRVLPKVIETPKKVETPKKAETPKKPVYVKTVNKKEEAGAPKNKYEKIAAVPKEEPKINYFKGEPVVKKQIEAAGNANKYTSPSGKVTIYKNTNETPERWQERIDAANRGARLDKSIKVG